MNIPYGRQSISEQDIDAVVAVLRSDFLTQGPLVPEFERSLGVSVGADHAVAVNSATSALHLACLALDLGPGDIAWTSPNTFVASANAFLHCGATVDFVDIDIETGNMCVLELEKKLEYASVHGVLPKIVMPVHFSGRPCEMGVIHKLSLKYGFRIVEDASHALGAVYQGKKIGNCQYSDVCVFSFHPVKIATAGEGGCVTTNCELLAKRIRKFASHGITADTSEMHPRSTSEIWNYQQVELGFNFRMSDIHAALGISQLGRADEFVSIRNRLASVYDAELGEDWFRFKKLEAGLKSSYHLYVIQMAENQQRRVYQHLWENGIRANLHYIPVHRHPYYERLGFSEGAFPNAEKFFRRALSIPLFADLRCNEQSLVIDVLNKFAMV